MFSGSFSGDSWQKFNIFSVLYIALVYLPFTADFYLYFIQNGLRQLTSYIALEAVVLMTIISMILMLLLLQECSCTGIAEMDLGGRAGLKKDKSMTKKKRRSLRSGMGMKKETTMTSMIVKKTIMMKHPKLNLRPRRVRRREMIKSQKRDLQRMMIRGRLRSRKGRAVRKMLNNWTC